MVWRRSIFAFASCLAILSCAPAGPTFHLQIVTAGDVTTLEPFSRLLIEIARCDVPAETAPLVIDVPFKTASAPEDTMFEVDVPPGVQFNAWLQAWKECAESCVPDHLAKTGDCRCVKAMPDHQAVGAEACSEWLMQAEGEKIVKLALTSSVGLCPISRDRCRM